MWAVIVGDFVLLNMDGAVGESADRLQATKDDPRKCPFGNLMRKTNINRHYKTTTLSLKNKVRLWLMASMLVVGGVVVTMAQRQQGRAGVVKQLTEYKY